MTFDSSLAACQKPEARGTNFFPEPADRAGIAAAKAVCARCPVIAECWTEFGQEPFGVVAGLDEMERRRLNNRNERSYRKSLASQLVRDGRR